MKLLGTSTVSKGYKTTIIKAVIEKLNLKEGDLIAYFEDENGKVVITKAEIVPKL
ncbi:AbrB/MazE/SpoVT family DNA-binding domain-containing protein [Archaeoglobus sp. JdFR-39]|jgi:bifunctional DNA-binding transcriptional regulator/antitoxin component of YhaV-PrlF toxin-antitoxin module|uniref:AbrB/MazE/SpoVT family DNA-binding domain-containing protein n=1 Tax=Archaeoglobus sp. JdFR-39 TaxID=1934996 RepID=UPI0025C6988F|nr:hypothetical protein [Archaeoglobus sp. JdFR-39]